jgi:hypothetical protein
VSYIRCLSNPERLYAWAQDDGYVHIMHHVEPPLASKRLESTEQMLVPSKLFEDACVEWERAGRFSRRGLVIREVSVSLKTSRPMRDSMGFREQVERHGEFEWFIRFQYKKRFFHMWPVTWEYIVTNVVFRGHGVHQKRKKRRA